MKNTEAKIVEQLIQLIQTRVSIEELQQHIDKINSNYIFQYFYLYTFYVTNQSLILKTPLTKKLKLNIIVNTLL